MTKLSKWMMAIWVVLAIASFITSFYLPLFPKILGLVFGGLNIITIITLVVSIIEGFVTNKKLKKNIGD